jgi:hypothetical protein
MNIYKMHEMFDQLLDEVATTRIDIPEFINLINLASLDIVKGRIDPIKEGNSPIYLQSVQRVREELKNLVKDTIITLSGDNIVLPADYFHYLLLRLSIGGVLVTAKPVTFDWLGANLDNPFVKPTDSRVKFIEIGTQLKTYKGSGTISAANSRLNYISKPTDVLWDDTVNFTSATTFTNDTQIVVVSGSITYQGNVYVVGQDVLIDVSVANQFTGGGTAQKIINSDIDEYLHDDIIRRAVSIQLSIIGDSNRKQVINFDEKTS